MNFKLVSDIAEAAALVAEIVLIVADSRILRRIDALRAGITPRLVPHASDTPATVKALRYDKAIIKWSWLGVLLWLSLLFIGYDDLSMMILVADIALNWDADWRLQQALIAQKKTKLS